MRQLERGIVVFVLSFFIFVFAAQAVMPPAPPEWYRDRLKIPIPEGAKKGMPQIPEQISKDLAEAAAKRPNNVDNILLILVQFPDHPANIVNHPPSLYDDLIFSTGKIPTGSLVEYYQEISYGAFTPAGTVVAWITAPNPYAYYVGDNYGMGSYPNNSQKLLEDCVTILDPTVDFSQFDNNGDGYADAIFLIHAGPGAEETLSPNDIWSHAWGYYFPTNDGVYTGRYSTEPECFMNGEMIAIGVFCHEYGHVLGLPDLYDTNGGSEGVGAYCLMGSGSWGALQGTPERPSHMCAEMKRAMGWMEPIDVIGTLHDWVIPPVETAPVCYRIYNPGNSNEYFLVENRAKVGFDSLFPGEGGLAVWHVDWNGYQPDETHRYVTLEQADGSFDLEDDKGGGFSDPRTDRSDAGDLYPGATGNHTFSFASLPDNLSYDQITSFATVANINYYADSIRADLLALPDIPSCRIISTTIYDTISGVAANFNSNADSGEVVDLIIKLACEGEGASSLSGLISTSDSRVSIVRPSADFGSVSTGSYLENNSAPFRFQILSPNSDSAVTFSLQLEADGDVMVLDFKVNINRQKILLVVDNNGTNWSENLVSAMYRGGYSFDVYNSAVEGTPKYEDLIPYHLVVWTTASYFGKRQFGGNHDFCVNSAEIAVLQNYLDSAGRLGLFSQDYLEYKYVTFNQKYFRLAGAISDVKTLGASGTSGGPLDGFSGTSRSSSYMDYTDQPLISAGGAYLMNDACCPDSFLAVYYPASGPQPGSFATTYSGYGIERFDSTSIESFLPDWYSWILSNLNIDIPMPISPKNGVTVYSAHPQFRWTESVGAANYHFQLATDSLFTNILKDSTVIGESLVYPSALSGNYYWRVGADSDDKPATPLSPKAYFVVIPCTCGDADGNGSVNILDVTSLVSYLYKGGPAPNPANCADVNSSGSINILDIAHIINYLYKGGSAPQCP